MFVCLCVREDTCAYVGEGGGGLRERVKYTVSSICFTLDKSKLGYTYVMGKEDQNVKNDVF